MNTCEFVCLTCDGTIDFIVIIILILMDCHQINTKYANYYNSIKKKKIKIVLEHLFEKNEDILSKAGKFNQPLKRKCVTHSYDISIYNISNKF